MITSQSLLSCWHWLIQNLVSQVQCLESKKTVGYCSNFFDVFQNYWSNLYPHTSRKIRVCIKFGKNNTCGTNTINRNLDGVLRHAPSHSVIVRLRWLTPLFCRPVRDSNGLLWILWASAKNARKNLKQTHEILGNITKKTRRKKWGWRQWAKTLAKIDVCL